MNNQAFAPRPAYAMFSCDHAEELHEAELKIDVHLVLVPTGQKRWHGLGKVLDVIPPPFSCNITAFQTDPVHLLPSELNQ